MSCFILMFMYFHVSTVVCYTFHKVNLVFKGGGGSVGFHSLQSLYGTFLKILSASDNLGSRHYILGSRPPFRPLNIETPSTL